MSERRMKRGTPFWDRMTRGDCWEWQGARHPKGYGQLRIDGSTHYAHRRAWELTHDRPVPDGMKVCHHCDNPPCCNPAHLFLGTQADNLRDMARKGRAARQRGEAHSQSKFTDEQVAQARYLNRQGFTNLEVAERTGISPSYVCRLVAGARR